MTPIRDLYPELREGDDFIAPGDYGPLLEDFGEVLLQYDEGGYQGDSFLIYYKEGRIGYLNFGWGSCSGCDALQGCGSVGDIEDLWKVLESDIKWFESIVIFKDYFLSHDFKGDYGSEGRDTFLEEVKELLVVLDGGLEGAPLYINHPKFKRVAMLILAGKIL